MLCCSCWGRSLLFSGKASSFFSLSNSLFVRPIFSSTFPVTVSTVAQNKRKLPLLKGDVKFESATLGGFLILAYSGSSNVGIFFFYSNPLLPHRSNCSPGVSVILRHLAPRPAFLPIQSESSALDWIFMGGQGPGAAWHVCCSSYCIF